MQIGKKRIEIQEYCQTENIRWLGEKRLESIVMERKSIEKNGRKTVECRYLISCRNLKDRNVHVFVVGQESFV